MDTQRQAELGRMIAAGAVLALGAAALQWLDYQRFARTRFADVALGLTGALFLAVGVYTGWRLFGRRVQRAAGNPQAVAALGISGRELDVLRALATGQANKEIARTLGVSPNTVKTHVARLYDKLDARNRTDAVGRARGLGILP